jgi:quinoprotein glucose dehydrogenase
MKASALRAALLVLSVAAAAPGWTAQVTRTSSGSPAAVLEQRDWPAYGGAPENSHYSSLAQINRSNVKRLAVAWTFDTQEEGGLQSSPLIVGGVLYGITPTQKIFALDATTGKLVWKFD